MAYETANKRFQKISWHALLLELGMEMPEFSENDKKRFKKLAIEKDEELFQLVRADIKRQESIKEVV